MNDVLGIDIGGMNTKVALVSRTGDIKCFAEADTPSAGGAEAEAALIMKIIEFLNLDRSSFDAIGVGVPGPVDKNGIVHSPPNLKGWGDVDIGLILSDLLRIEKSNILVGNDVNFAALAEYHYGNGVNANPLVMLTLGTGVGGAVIIDGNPMLGKSGFAAELGHIVIDPAGPRCGCGRRGCAEAVISHRGIVRMAWKILKREKGSMLWSMIDGQFDALTPKEIQMAADIGDPAANMVLKIVSQKLGILLADLTNTFNPERIVIGGGISKWGEALLSPARKIVKRFALKNPARDVKIVRAKYYKKAGVLGAATAIINKLKKK